jgi:hypothetical protein
MEKQKNDLVIALKQLANRMDEVAQMMRVYARRHVKEHSIQLAGAADIARSWADSIELDNIK